MTASLLAALLFLASALAALGYGLGPLSRPNSVRRSVAKTLPVALLAMAAAFAGAPWPIAAGLALGALGDLMLSRPGSWAFLAGMAAFAAGHLAYAGVFLVPANAAGALMPFVPVFLIALSTEFWLAPRTGALRWPVRGYVLVIAAMAFAALTLPPGFGLALAGAALFLASDVILAAEMFVLAPGPAKRRASVAVWALYWSGQALILLGMSAPFLPFHRLA